MSKTTRLSVLCLVFLGMHLSLFGQMGYWVTPPYRFSMWPSVTSTTIPNAFGPYSVANGVYDETNSLLFYADQYSINNNNGGIGQLGDLIGNPQVPSEGYFITSTEIAIVPIPGLCRQYYVIYGKDNPVGGCPLMYIKVNASGATPVITYNGAPVIYQSPYPPYNWITSQQAFGIGGHFGSDNISFAISKAYTGTGASTKRWLYSVGTSGVVRSEISSTGFTNGVVIASAATLGLSSLDFASYELELSWGGNYLAWTSSFSNKAFVIQVNPATGAYVANSLQTITIAGAKGLEFTNVTTIPKLYVTGTSGLNQVILSPLGVTVIATGTYSLANSYLEYGKNNRIYGVAPTYSGSTLTATTFVGIAPSNNTFTTVNAGFDSRYTVSGAYTSNVFTLPDQIDGENYTYFNGNPDITIASFTINGLSSLGDCDNGFWIDIPSCNPISMNATYNNGTPTQYKIDLVSANGCSPSAGMNYLGAWINGAPPANFDLRSLTDGAGYSLNNLTGYFMVTFSVKNACGTIRSTARFFKVIAPVPALVSLQIYNKANPQAYLSPSQNIASPVNVGTSTIGYRINNSTGTITSHRVLIEEVTSAGVFVKLIYDVTKTVNGVSNLTYENLNSYCVNSTVWGFTPAFGNCTNSSPSYSGFTGYFSYTNGQLSFGRYYKLTVFVGNVCGSSSNFSYLYVGSIGNKTAGQEASEIIPMELACTLIPNPAEAQVTLQYAVPSTGSYTLEVVDLTGRTLFQTTSLLKQGEGEMDLDLSMLAPGSYLYRLRDQASMVTGRFVKL